VSVAPAAAPAATNAVPALPIPPNSGIQVPVPGAPGDLRVTVTGVNDMRVQTNMGIPNCTLMLSFSGDLVGDGIIDKVRVTRAADDTGRDLVTTGETGIFQQNNLITLRSPMSFYSVRLRNPVRKATEIAVLEGEVSIGRPTESNGGVIHASHLFDQPGQPLSMAALQKLGVEVTFLTREAYAAKAEQLHIANEASSPDMAATTGQPAGVVPAAAGSARARNFPRMAVELPPWSVRNVGVLLVRDPGRVLLRLSLNDADGNRLPANTMNRMEYVMFQFQDPPPADAVLEVTTAAPGIPETYPFRLEHIALP
jgi:hypothetical protein